MYIQEAWKLKESSYVLLKTAKARTGHMQRKSELRTQPRFFQEPDFPGVG